MNKEYFIEAYTLGYIRAHKIYSNTLLMYPFFDSLYVGS